MAVTRPGSTAAKTANEVRTDVTSADNATINTTNFPVDIYTDCSGWKTVRVYPRFTGGTNPTVKVQPLVLLNGTWVIGTLSSALAEGVFLELEVMGGAVFFRLETITGSPTNLDLFCQGWEPFRFDGPARG